MRYRCEHCGTVLMCVPCENRAYHQARGSRAAVDDSCPECESYSTQLSHLCVQIFDEFTHTSAVAALPEMLAHPGSEVAGRRRVDVHGLLAHIVSPAIVFAGPSAEFITGHIQLPSSGLGTIVEGGRRPEVLGYFLKLQAARFLLKTHVEREIHLRLTTEWSSEFARVRGEVEDVLHRGATVILHRLYVGRTG